VDILADGALDLEDEGLALLDWVIVSLHSRLDQPPAVATERVLRAISHPRVHAMAHPTARLIGSREPVKFDMERVLARAAELGVAMEINAHPDRTDLNDAHARQARDKGIGLVINTDAHSTVQLANMRYGVFSARRAGLTKDDVLNARPLADFRRRIRRTGGPAPAAAAPARGMPGQRGGPAPVRAAAPRPGARAGVAEAAGAGKRPATAVKSIGAGASKAARPRAKGRQPAKKRPGKSSR
jgi:hypothetical protein